MKAISINQPWAEAIINHGKDIENRDWKTSYRGEALIHAGLKTDDSSGAFISRHSNALDLDPLDYQIGGIVGIAEVVDCVRESDSPWFFGAYGFVLRNARPIPFRPCKGALGFFTPDYTKLYAKDIPRPPLAAKPAPRQMSFLP